MTCADETIEIRGHSDLAESLIAVGAWAASSVTLVVGANPAWGVLAVMIFPIVAFVYFGQIPGRGAVVAVIASALAVAMIAGGPRANPLLAVVLIGMIEVAAVAGGRAADRFARWTPLAR